METVVEEGFRVALPVRAKSGRFVVEGWCAARWIAGTTAMAGRWGEAMAACQAFGRAVRGAAWSPVLARGENPFVRADAAVWGEWPVDVRIGPTAERLRGLMRPVGLKGQLIQGDPSEGNLLFAAGVSPGIIDVAPYWHPADYMVAMLIADGIAWSKAPVGLLEEVAGWPEMGQLLMRAVLFRLYVGYLFRGGEAGAERRAEAYAAVIGAVERWA